MDCGFDQGIHIMRYALKFNDGLLSNLRDIIARVRASAIFLFVKMRLVCMWASARTRLESVVQVNLFVYVTCINN